VEENDNDMSNEKTTERAPMLGDSQRSFIISKHVWKGDKFGKALKIADEVRDFYEAKRASGELRVVKRIPRSEAKQHVLLCNEQMYDAMDAHFEDYIDFCPGCGASIVDT
jgi:hypothetical protein